MLKKTQGKWFVLGGLLIVVAVALFALGACASTETKSDAMVMAKANPCNPCAAKAKINPCNPCAVKKAANPCNPCNPCAVKKAANPCNPCNPCAVKKAANPCNPCNPCAVKKAANPCNPCNPCAVKKAANPCNPCAAKNPCNPCGAKNPCNPCGGGKVDAKMVQRPAGSSMYPGDKMQLVAEGKRLWQDKSLGTSGLACGTCHVKNGNFNKTFLKPYPHYAAMPHQQAGIKQVSADEMVQFCMIVPMAGKPLDWGSRELAALAAYTGVVQQQFKAAVAANPCLIKSSAANPCNPCGARNPCNPCAAKNPCNPCAAKNPCNPCAAKNPCNPCGKK